MTNRGLILFPDGRVDEIDEDGETITATAKGLYAELAAAGYPLYGDEGLPDAFDVSVDDHGQVTAYTCSPEPGDREQPMGRVTPKLALWLQLTRED